MTVVTAVQQLTTDEPHDHESFYVANEAVGSLTGTGNIDAAIEASEIIGNAFRDHEDAELAAQAADALANAQRFRFQKNVDAAVVGGQDEEDQLLDVIQGLLADSPSSSALGQIMDVAQRIENSTKLSLAKRIYSVLAKATANTDESDDMLDLVKGGLKASRPPPGTRRQAHRNYGCNGRRRTAGLECVPRQSCPDRLLGDLVRALFGGTAKYQGKLPTLSRPRPGSRGSKPRRRRGSPGSFLKRARPALGHRRRARMPPAAWQIQTPNATAWRRFLS